MPIYERGDTFLVSVGSGKDRFRATCDTYEEAERIELAEKLRRKSPQKRLEAAQAASEKPVRGKLLKDAHDLTMRLHWRGEKAEKTHIINSRAVLDILGDNTPLACITAEMVTEMVLDLEEAGNSGSTVNKKASCYSMMMKTAVSQGWITDFPKAPRRKENQHRIRWMDEDEELRVLSLCQHLGLYDLYDYIVVAIDTGFRRGEMLGLEPRDFSSGLIHLHAGSTKSNDARSVPATKRVTEILNKRSHYKKVFECFEPHSLRGQWERIRGLLKMDEDTQFIVHMLRHTCASRLVQRGVPLAVVQKWMGHKKIETTLRYAHLAPDSLLMGVEALERPKPKLTSNIVEPRREPEEALEDF